MATASRMTIRFLKPPLSRLRPLPKSALTLSCFVAVAGCMTATIEEDRQAPTRITSSDAIVLLAKPQLEGIGTEQEFLDCLEKELVGREVSATVAKAQERGESMGLIDLPDAPFQVFADHLFIDALYPWLEPSTAPANGDGLGVLLARPGVAQRVSDMGVRYVVWVEGATRKTDGGGSIACGAGPGGAGCLGLGWWEKQSDYQATVWDMENGVDASTVTTDVKGTSVMIGAIAPIPIITPVQSTACDRLARQLKSFLVGDEPHVAAVAADGS